MQYRIEPRFPCYINGGCLRNTCYFVQVLQQGLLFDKWVDIKGFATMKKAQEFKKNIRAWIITH